MANFSTWMYRVCCSLNPLFSFQNRSYTSLNLHCKALRLVLLKNYSSNRFTWTDQSTFYNDFCFLLLQSSSSAVMVKLPYAKHSPSTLLRFYRTWNSVSIPCLFLGHLLLLRRNTVAKHNILISGQIYCPSLQKSSARDLLSFADSNCNSAK